MKQSRRDTGKPVALVTGAGRRLGRQIVLTLAQSGYSVVVNYFESRHSAEQTVNLIKSEGGEAISLRANVAQQKQVERMVRAAVQRYGKIDLLVNNAAVFVEAEFPEIKENVWNRTIDINLKGVFLCCQAVSRVMLKQKTGGKIINISSLGSLQAWKKHLPYSVSKAGVNMLTRCLAKALAPLIQVNAIAPGTIIIEGEEDPNLAHIPSNKILLRRYGEPSDITNAVLYLATRAPYMTGQILVVDGGRSIQ